MTKLARFQTVLLLLLGLLLLAGTSQLGLVWAD